MFSANCERLVLGLGLLLRLELLLGLGLSDADMVGEIVVGELGASGPTWNKDWYTWSISELLIGSVRFVSSTNTLLISFSVSIS